MLQAKWAAAETYYIVYHRRWLTFSADMNAQVELILIWPPRIGSVAAILVHVSRNAQTKACEALKSWADTRGGRFHLGFCILEPTRLQLGSRGTVPSSLERVLLVHEFYLPQQSRVTFPSSLRRQSAKIEHMNKALSSKEVLTKIFRDW